jgi:hypothetical protein
MALSEMTVRHARITGNDYTLGDSDGLTLNVTARGGKVWLFRYYWAGKQKRMSLGCYPQISLKKKRVQDVTMRAPWSPKALTLLSIVNKRGLLFML